MFKRLKEILRRLLATHAAWPVLLSVGLLCAAGLLALQVAAPARADQQQKHVALGGLVLLLMLVPHYQTIGRMAYAIMGGVALLLVAVLVTEPINGARRWFALPGSLALQPSELAKIAFVLALAWYLRYRRNFRELSGLVGPFVLMLIPMALILVEPDLGTALLFPLALYAMLVAAGARLRHLILIAVVGVVMLPGFYPLLKDYQKARIRSLVVQVTSQQDDSFMRTHLRGAGYHGQMSKIAVGSGGAYGHGIESVDVVRRGLLPEAHTDFIFAVICSQWGFVGAIGVLGLYLAFLAASLEIAASTKDPFGRLVAVGISTMMIGQAFINMAMVIGLAPVVGITLPFLSYGGSSLLTNMVAVGLLLNVSVRRNTVVSTLPASYAAA